MKYKCLDLFKAIKYIDGVLDPEETDYYETHLESCKKCGKLVEGAKEIEEKIFESKGTLVKKIEASLDSDRQFEQELAAKGCLTIKTMEDYLHKRLSSKEIKYVEKHMKECNDCAEELQIIKEIEEKLGPI